MGKRGQGSGRRAGGFGRRRVEEGRVEEMVGGVNAKLQSPRMCLIWGAVETPGWAASAKSKQKWLKGTERYMFHASSSLCDCILLAKFSSLVQKREMALFFRLYINIYIYMKYIY